MVVKLGNTANAQRLVVAEEHARMRYLACGDAIELEEGTEGADAGTALRIVQRVLCTEVEDALVVGGERLIAEWRTSETQYFVDNRTYIMGKMLPHVKYSSKRSDFLRFYAYLCHAINDFAGLDLQH